MSRSTSTWELECHLTCHAPPALMTPKDKLLVRLNWPALRWRRTIASLVLFHGLYWNCQTLRSLSACPQVCPCSPDIVSSSHVTFVSLLPNEAKTPRLSSFNYLFSGTLFPTPFNAYTKLPLSNMHWNATGPYTSSKHTHADIPLPLPNSKHASILLTFSLSLSYLLFSQLQIDAPDLFRSLHTFCQNDYYYYFPLNGDPRWGLLFCPGILGRTPLIWVFGHFWFFCTMV